MADSAAACCRDGLNLFSPAQALGIGTVDLSRSSRQHRPSGLRRFAQLRRVELTFRRASPPSRQVRVPEPSAHRVQNDAGKAMVPPQHPAARPSRCRKLDAH